ncbi:MAG: hypothetical protein COS87_01840 [Chloroflexi bacterium CG07_land_8_20_14_0_80_45_17]|nr:MAG: hypothetical protein COX14_01950 [Chloroflexi bacterium CG23_combo_of_CG06-09_8_20_14_all_45_10]PIU56556.1 MAG: hypothetical protein COS87_01840 [Chloroflexi bacterium CG07_land_8_20_14_0_80_45_17]
MVDRYVLDTSAIMTMWQDEDGSNDVAGLIAEAAFGGCELYLSFMTFFEAYYITKRKAGESKALEIYYWLTSSSAKRVNLEEDILVKAGDLKAKYQISAADAWIIATALFKNAAVVHKDSEFDRITDLPIAFMKVPRSGTKAQRS